MDLPANWNIHNAFHVSLLWRYVGDPPTDPIPQEPPEVEDKGEILLLEQIIHHEERQLKSRVLHRKYLVKFKNYSPLDAQWMTEKDLQSFPDILSNYLCENLKINKSCLI